MKNLQNLKIEGYTGRWSAFDSYRNYYILENDYYGDETCYLVINENNNVICETYDDIVTALEDLGII